MMKASAPERPPLPEVVVAGATLLVPGETAFCCAFDSPKPGVVVAGVVVAGVVVAGVVVAAVEVEPAASAAGAASPAAQQQASDEIRSESASRRRMDA